MYRSFMLALRAYQRLFMDLRVHGRTRIPPGPKIFAQNHVSSTDPYWVLPLLPEPVHVIIGPGYQTKVAGWVLDRFEQINATPAHRKTVVDEAVRRLLRGESIYTAPEGDIQEPFTLGRFYPGVARIYRRTRAPIIPIALAAPKRALRAFPRFDIDVDGRIYKAVFVLRGPYAVSFGKPFTPEIRNDVDETTDNERITEELKRNMERLLDELRHKEFMGE